MLNHVDISRWLHFGSYMNPDALGFIHEGLGWVIFTYTYQLGNDLYLVEKMEPLG